MPSLVSLPPETKAPPFMCGCEGVSDDRRDPAATTHEGCRAADVFVAPEELHRLGRISACTRPGAIARTRRIQETLTLTLLLREPYSVTQSLPLAVALLQSLMYSCATVSLRARCASQAHLELLEVLRLGAAVLGVDVDAWAR